MISLPNDALLSITLFLDAPALCDLEVVCKQLSAFMTKNRQLVWRQCFFMEWEAFNKQMRLESLSTRTNPMFNPDFKQQVRHLRRLYPYRYFLVDTITNEECELHCMIYRNETKAISIGTWQSYNANAKRIVQRTRKVTKPRPCAC